MEKREKVSLSDVERKIEQLPFFNPEKKWELNFGQYLSVIDTEITDLKELIRLFKKDTLEFLEETGLTVTGKFNFEEKLADVFRKKCFDGEGKDEDS